jgi:hypothetical protein
MQEQPFRREKDPSHWLSILLGVIGHGSDTTDHLLDSGFRDLISPTAQAHILIFFAGSFHCTGTLWPSSRKGCDCRREPAGFLVAIAGENGEVELSAKHQLHEINRKNHARGG